jgi:hypothetical protein
VISKNSQITGVQTSAADQFSAQKKNSKKKKDESKRSTWGG